MSPLLIGLVGRAGAGKDTVGKVLVNSDHFNAGSYAWALLAFAKPIKLICRDLFLFSDEQVWGALKEIPDQRYPRPGGTFLTPREAMQVLGTEFGRRCYPNIWVEVTLREAAERRSNNFHAAITDCRFVNEAKAIKDAGGHVWRILRPSADNVPATHQSETEMNRPEMGKLVDKVICNNSTLEDLAKRVEEALK